MSHSASPAIGAAARFRARRRAGGGDSQLGTVAVLVGIWAVMVLGTAAFKPRFLDVDTFTAISYSVVILAPLCVGLALVTISGGQLDLSCGIVATVASMLSASWATDGWPTVVIIVAVVAFGAAVGAFNGGAVAWLGLDPVVATLATSFIGIGIVELQSVSLQMPLESPMRSFAFGRPLGVTNLVFVALPLLLAVDYFLRSTRAGRHVVALGGNAVAATRQGISQARIRFFSFVFSGACAALGGLMLAASSDVVSARAEGANIRTFQVASAVLLAGIALGGGRGRPVSLIGSLLVITTIGTVVVTLGFPLEWATVIQGAVLGVALALDGRRAKRKVAR